MVGRQTRINSVVSLLPRPVISVPRVPFGPVRPRRGLGPRRDGRWGDVNVLRSRGGGCDALGGIRRRVFQDSGFIPFLYFLSSGPFSVCISGAFSCCISSHSIAWHGGLGLLFFLDAFMPCRFLRSRFLPLSAPFLLSALSPPSNRCLSSFPHIYPYPHSHPRQHTTLRQTEKGGKAGKGERRTGKGQSLVLYINTHTRTASRSLYTTTTPGISFSLLLPLVFLL